MITAVPNCERRRFFSPCRVVHVTQRRKWRHDRDTSLTHVTPCTTPRTSGGRCYNTDKLLAEIVHAYIDCMIAVSIEAKQKPKNKSKTQRHKTIFNPRHFPFSLWHVKITWKKYMWFNWESISQVWIINSFRFDI